MNPIGKTISRIEEGPTDPEYRYSRGDEILIHFTDGTALSVTGSSYEEVSLACGTLDRAAVNEYARAAQGRREKQRLRQLERAAWDALPQEVKDEREVARRAKLSPMGRMLEDVNREMIEAWRRDVNRMGFGSTITIPVAKKTKARRS